MRGNPCIDTCLERRIEGREVVGTDNDGGRLGRSPDLANHSFECTRVAHRHHQHRAVLGCDHDRRLPISSPPSHTDLFSVFASLMILSMKHKEITVSDLQSLAPGPVVLTNRGQGHMKARLATLIERQRHMAEAAGLGGLLPGDEYAEVASEVQRLSAVLDRVVSPRAITDDPRIIELGDAVTIEHDDGAIEKVVLTNALEAIAADEHVSIGSPLGLALLGRSVGDRVEVRAPQGAYHCTIVRRSRAR